MLSADAPIRVQMEDISKSFGAIKSLDGVNLVLRAGEVLGLVGDNGAGKSTLSKILSGAVVPDAGRLLLDGREVRFASPADARRQRARAESQRHAQESAASDALERAERERVAAAETAIRLEQQARRAEAEAQIINPKENL